MGFVRGVAGGAVKREGDESGCYGSWWRFSCGRRNAGRFAFDGRGTMESA